MQTLVVTEAKKQHTVTAKTKMTPTEEIKKEPTKKTEKPSKDEPAISPSAALKSYCLSKKTATPVFKDLGESKAKNGKSEYRIECICQGINAVGVGVTRQEAREQSAKEILKKVKKK